MYELASRCFGLNISLVNDCEVAAKLKGLKTTQQDFAAHYENVYGEKTYGVGPPSYVCAALTHYSTIVEIGESFVPAVANAVLRAEQDSSTDKTVVDPARLLAAEKGRADLIKMLEKVVRFFFTFLCFAHAFSPLTAYKIPPSPLPPHTPVSLFSHCPGIVEA